MFIQLYTKKFCCEQQGRRVLIDTQMTDTLNTTTTAATLHRGWQTCSSFLILHITNVQIGSHNFPGRLGVCSQGHGPPLLSGIWDPYENATNGNDKNSHALLKAEAIFSHHTPKKISAESGPEPYLPLEVQQRIRGFIFKVIRGVRHISDLYI